jgi:hypothetical protein
MGKKPLGDRALSPAERQRKWRLQHPTVRRKRRSAPIHSSDDHDERQAVIAACAALVCRLKEILESPPTEQ